jgi:hypothetical protein
MLRTHTLRNPFLEAPKSFSVAPINVIGFLKGPYYSKMMLPPDFLLSDTDGADPERGRSTEHDFRGVCNIRI